MAGHPEGRIYPGRLKNPAQGMNKIFGGMPGFGDGMKKMFEEFGQRKTVMLRTEMQLYSSMFAQMAQHMQKEGQPLPPSYDPNAPFIQVTQEVDELSTAPLEDALFQVPEGYQVSPMADLMKTLTQPKMKP